MNCNEPYSEESVDIAIFARRARPGDEVTGFLTQVFLRRPRIRSIILGGCIGSELVVFVVLLCVDVNCKITAACEFGFIKGSRRLENKLFNAFMIETKPHPSRPMRAEKK
jgi:hypothetical protein